MPIRVTAPREEVAKLLAEQLTPSELALLQIAQEEEPPDPFEPTPRRLEPVMTIVIPAILGGAAYDVVKWAVLKAHKVLVEKYGNEKVTHLDDGTG